MKKTAHVETCKVSDCPTCRPHDFQDKRYGQRQRVFNRAKTKSADRQAWVCTICGVRKEV